MVPSPSSFANEVKQSGIAYRVIANGVKQSRVACGNWIASPCGFAMTWSGMLDCFTLRVRNDEGGDCKIIHTIKTLITQKLP
ncbi:MAG: hypothetical protein LBB84_13110 [Tannerellaceae bacterium]|nr:hypothetical protein [Tannerellaceae bacterium]